MTTPPNPRRPPPIPVVQSLASQGRSEKEIIRTLKSQGYDNEEISKALNVALKRKVTGAPQPPISRAPDNPMHGTPAGFEFVAPQPAMQQEIPPGEQSIEMTEEEEIGLEELIEEIINEKWISIEEEMGKLEKIYIQVEEQIKFLNQRMNKIEENEEEKRQEIKEMLTESASHIEGIESRIGSVERAFKEFLPTLTDNVRSLSGIVNKMKGKVPIEEKKTTQ